MRKRTAAGKKSGHEVLPSGVSNDEADLLDVLSDLLPGLARLDDDLHRAASSVVTDLKRRGGIGEFDPQLLTVVNTDD